MHCAIHIYVVHITLNSLFCIFMLVVGPFLGSVSVHISIHVFIFGSRGL